MNTRIDKINLESNENINPSNNFIMNLENWQKVSTLNTFLKSSLDDANKIKEKIRSITIRFLWILYWICWYLITTHGVSYNIITIITIAVISFFSFLMIIYYVFILFNTYINNIMTAKNIEFRLWFFKKGFYWDANTSLLPNHWSLYCWIKYRDVKWKLLETIWKIKSNKVKDREFFDTLVDILHPKYEKNTKDGKVKKNMDKEYDDFMERLKKHCFKYYFFGYGSTNIENIKYILEWTNNKLNNKKVKSDLDIINELDKRLDEIKGNVLDNKTSIEIVRDEFLNKDKARDYIKYLIWFINTAMKSYTFDVILLMLPIWYFVFLVALVSYGIIRNIIYVN